MHWSINVVSLFKFSIDALFPVPDSPRTNTGIAIAENLRKKLVKVVFHLLPVGAIFRHCYSIDLSYTWLNRTKIGKKNIKNIAKSVRRFRMNLIISYPP